MDDDDDDGDDEAESLDELEEEEFPNFESPDDVDEMPEDGTRFLRWKTKTEARNSKPKSVKPVLYTPQHSLVKNCVRNHPEEETYRNGFAITPKRDFAELCS